jgi:hypothetical protein
VILAANVSMKQRWRKHWSRIRANMLSDETTISSVGEYFVGCSFLLVSHLPDVAGC